MAIRFEFVANALQLCSELLDLLDQVIGAKPVTLRRWVYPSATSELLTTPRTLNPWTRSKIWVWICQSHLVTLGDRILVTELQNWFDLNLVVVKCWIVVWFIFGKDTQCSNIRRSTDDCYWFQGLLNIHQYRHWQQPNCSPTLKSGIKPWKNLTHRLATKQVLLPRLPRLSSPLGCRSPRVKWIEVSAADQYDDLVLVWNHQELVPADP